MTLSLRTLGPVEVSLDGAPPPPDLLWKKPLALLIYLSCSVPRGRSREHLAELLWPQGNAGQSLNQALVSLRKVLPDSSLRSEGEIVSLEPGAIALDLDRFRRLAADSNWSEAAGLVTGEFCEGMSIKGASEFDDWLVAERLRWRESAVEVLLRHTEQLLDAGDLRAALEEARRACELDTLSEPAIRALLRTLALGDQRTTALEEYQNFVRRIDEALGLEPSHETHELVERIRHQPLRQRAPNPSAGAADSRRAPLVGRVTQLGHLLESWGVCRRDSQATILVIEGDPGSGKSRLAEEFLARIRLDGAAIASVRMVEADFTAPDAALLGLARGGLLDARGLAGASPSALASLGSVLAEWSSRFPGAEGVGIGPGQALSDVVGAAAAEQPTVLFVDDAQWADPESLQALGLVLRDHARSQIVVLLAIYPRPGRAEIDAITARAGRDLAGRTIRVEPLKVEEIRGLARWALPRLTEIQVDRVARRVFVDSAGLPLLAVELLHAVALGLDLGQIESTWPAPFSTLSDTLPGDLPDSVVAAIRVGFRRLGRHAQQLLIVVAVLGDRIPREDLGGITEFSTEALDTGLDELEWQRWLISDARGYSFVARIARQVVDRDMVTAGQRERILRRRPLGEGKSAIHRGDR